MSGGERLVLRGIVGHVLCNASNFPERVSVRVLGQDMGPLIDKTVDALIAAGFGDVARAKADGWDEGYGDPYSDPNQWRENPYRAGAIT